MTLSKGLTLSAHTSTFQPLNNLHYVILAFLLAVCTTCIPHDSLLQRRGLLFLHIACVAQVFLAPPPLDVPNTAALYKFGVLGANLAVRYFDRLYTYVPEHAFHRINADGRQEDATKLPIIQRFLWPPNSSFSHAAFAGTGASPISGSLRRKPDHNSCGRTS